MDSLEHLGSHSGAEAKRNAIGENKADDAEVVTDVVKFVRKMLWLSRTKLSWSEVVLPVLIA